MSDEDVNPDTFKILVASDIHLGVNEKDHIRGNDSFNTFEEILQIAQQNDVDFILLGGDLFHDNKPSQVCMHKCITLLKKYCLGEKPIMFEFLSEQSSVFHHQSQSVVNYEDPNLNVSFPVFSIHGNHDDPMGQEMISALDVLSAAGLVNYFGKWLNLTQVDITPMLMQKGQTRLAVYGLSHIKDARLRRLFADRKVKSLRPDNNTDKWFNIFVIHQNRAPRGVLNFIPEETLPDFIDFVLWGHEHDCRITPEYHSSRHFHVCQPGSSVATSLAEAESLTKKVGLLTVTKKDFEFEEITLETVRPFVFRHISVWELDIDNAENPSEQVQLLAIDEVKSMLRKAADVIKGKPKRPKLPLIRLRIAFNNENQLFNTVHFGQNFEENVANPSDVILFSKDLADPKEKRNLLDEKAIKRALDDEDEMRSLRVEDYVKKYFREVGEDEKFNMKVLSAAGLNESVSFFVNKSDQDAVEEIVRHQMSRAVQHLSTLNVTDESIDEDLLEYKAKRERERRGQKDDESEEARLHLSSTLPTRSQRGHRLDAAEDDADELSMEQSVDEDDVPGADGVWRGRGRGTRAARAPRSARAPRAARGRGRGAQPTLMDSFNLPQSSRASQRNSTKAAASNRSRIDFSDSD